MNPRKAAFVQSYLVSGNATEAAKAAGYSARTARQQGSRLLSDAAICAALSTARQQAAGKLELTAEVVLGEFLLIATSDIGDYFDDEGALRPLKDLTPEQRRAIASVEIEEETEKHGRVRKLKLWPKNDAADKLARHLGLYERDNEQAGRSFADLVLAAQRHREGKR